MLHEAPGQAFPCLDVPVAQLCPVGFGVREAPDLEVRASLWG